MAKFVSEDLSKIAFDSPAGLDSGEIAEIADSLAKVFSDESSKVANEEFDLLSTIRYDPQLPENEQFFLLDYHIFRLNLAIQFFQWDIDITAEVLLDHLKEAVKGDPTIPYKLRVLLSSDRTLKVEAYKVPQRSDLLSGLGPYTPPTSEFYKVYVDPAPTPIGPFTSFKTTHRDVYTEARNRMQLINECQDQDGRPCEILLHNPRGDVTEGSITNIALWRDGTWVTPPLVSGCLFGVTRQYLLSTGKVQERETIAIDTVQDGERILIFNGIIGVCQGQIFRK
uniref:ARAD1C22836p n=1 Tax=Blastobotrys adeninivorans TaxID=409370 RepID=A0A060T191_BLAAD